jgi:hypothetical protein
MIREIRITCAFLFQRQAAARSGRGDPVSSGSGGGGKHGSRDDTGGSAEDRRGLRLGDGSGRGSSAAKSGRAGGLESLWRDVRYGLRGLARNPGFAIVAVLTLALAIGLNTTIFSLLDQALLSALPVKNPEQLVVLSFAGDHPGHTHSDGGNTPGHAHEFSYPMYKDLRDQNKVFSGLIAAAPTEVGVTWNNHAESVGAEMVSGNYFEVLGVQSGGGAAVCGER